MKCDLYYLFIGHILLRINKVVTFNYPPVSCNITPISDENNKVKCFSDPYLRSSKALRWQHKQNMMGPLSKIKELEIDLGMLNIWSVPIDVILKFTSNVNLVNLTIKSKLEIEDFRPTTTPQKNHKLLVSLSHMTSLEYLTVENCRFDDRYEWKLPPSLRYLSFANSSYSWFDLTNQPNLYHINFEGNKLKRVPRMSSPEPPIVVLNFKKNEEFYVTAIDIAPLCKLEKLLIVNPFYKLTIKNREICECKMLKEWGLMQRITITTNTGPLADIDCKETPSSNCSMYSLAEAEKLRNECINRLMLSQTDDDVYDIYKNHIYVGIGIIVVICALFIFYGIKEFMMRKVDLDAELDYETYMEDDEPALPPAAIP